MSEKLNTHYYDGQLKALKGLIKKVDLTFNDCLNEIKSESEKLNDKTIKNNIAKVNAVLIADRKGNYDPINDIKLEELLPYIWSVIKNYEQSYKNVFFEQFSDILNGSCPQGRITRMWQFIPNK